MLQRNCRGCTRKMLGAYRLRSAAWIGLVLRLSRLGKHVSEAATSVWICGNPERAATYVATLSLRLSTWRRCAVLSRRWCSTCTSSRSTVALLLLCEFRCEL